MADGPVQKFALPKAVLKKLKSSKPVRLELGVVVRDNKASYWWLVDDEVVGPTVPVPSGFVRSM